MTSDDSLLILGLPVRTILDEAAVSLGDKPLPAPAWHLLDDVIIDNASLEKYLFEVLQSQQK